MRYMQSIAKQMVHLAPDLLLSCLETLRAEMVWVWHLLVVFWGIPHSRDQLQRMLDTAGCQELVIS